MMNDKSSSLFFGSIDCGYSQYETADPPTILRAWSGDYTSY